MEYAQVCDAGRVRKVNQDAILAAGSQDTGLFAVADGMGGHSQGEKASRHMIRRLEEWWDVFCPEKYESSFMKMMDGLKRLLWKVNREIYDRYNQEDICGSTIVLLFIYKNAYGIMYAGDSRIYMCHGWKFRQMTADEVWENQPDLTSWEREKKWEQCHGRLYNAVGVRREMQCSMLTDELKHGMVFLLCSDGLYQYCSTQYLKKCVRKAGRDRDLKAGAQALLKKVYEGEAGDNISLILVQV